ncbi:MAG: ATP-binding protein [Pseudomonadota bacterium]|nr:ATP-binding protein [Pseudomonadota bacterium]
MAIPPLPPVKARVTGRTGAWRAASVFSIGVLLLGFSAGLGPRWGSARAAEPSSESRAPLPLSLRLDRALSVASSGAVFPDDTAAQPVSLPDRWSSSKPGYTGVVWYRVEFTFGRAALPDELLALYVEQACSNLQVLLNGRLIYSGGRMVEPVTRHCAQPHLVTLPPALLNADGNVLHLRVLGEPVQSVGSVRRAGRLSALELGTQSALSAAHAGRTFWEPAWVRGSSLVLFALGCLMLAIGWLHRREVYFSYFGTLCLGVGVMSMAVWSLDLPWENSVTEFMLVSGWPVLLACAVQFLLSFAGLRSRAIENVVALQWVAVPLTLMLAGKSHLFLVANAWYVLLSAELLGVLGIYLVTARKLRPGDYAPVLAAGVVGTVVLLYELGVQLGLVDASPVSLSECALPVVLIYIGGRLFMLFARALRDTVADRNQLAEKVLRATVDMDVRVEQLAATRAAQLIAERVADFTQQERRRIASDLHDDLGAKLLTIVHTKESERIPQLAREALEEMRLSVRGLASRPVLLEDALADWRAEVVNRLAQAGVAAHWSRPEETLEQMLTARVFMQVTRILREAINNVIKHAEAGSCSVRFNVAEGSLRLRVHDDGRGISKGPRQGQGMATMKKRAKKINGQCLLESAPGRGTVILLTVPL